MDKVDLNIEQAYQEDGRFRIDSDSKAEWALSKLREVEDERKRLVSLCAEKMHEYELRIYKINREFDAKTDRFKAMLAEYFETVPHKTTKAGSETYRLATGKLMLKKREPLYIWDDIALVDWLKRSGNVKYIKQEPAWGEFKKRTTIDNGQLIFADTGELVEGVTVEDRPPEFQVDIGR